ncbi:MAG: hypothetical protein ACNS62_23940 [Candidatus Cyclobacteriaceae bacterium M3_2C_046]
MSKNLVSQFNNYHTSPPAKVYHDDDYEAEETLNNPSLRRFKIGLRERKPVAIRQWNAAKPLNLAINVSQTI